MTGEATLQSPRVRVLADRDELGRVAAHDVAAEIRQRLAGQEQVRMVLAAAPSQQETLLRLRDEPGIDWTRVTSFHMDEYLELSPEAPERFGNWLRHTFFDHVPLRAAHLIEPGTDPDGCARRYAELLAEAPIDVVCIGIGVNGHLAFNDPPVADLADPLDVKVVELDHECRMQQVTDECFDTLDEVPHAAVTLTVPRLLAADRLFCMVPGRGKRHAVRQALTGPIGAQCPATALRTHPDCMLYLDEEAAPDDV
ncbi:MAG: glucosamine-6-phosphate deaminase [Streptosporangiales bacterium]|nr:glucosamine-6-phosphate deaminase [Streptosporangiales bacterium]